MIRTNILLLLSGSLCSGKSTLTQKLIVEGGANCVRSREILSALAPKDFLKRYETLREGLISYAQHLDEQTHGSWIAEQLHSDQLRDKFTVLDAIRLRSQFDCIREKFRGKLDVLHVHLKASDAILSRRFGERNENSREATQAVAKDYIESKEHLIEAKSAELESFADLVILTDELSPEEVYSKVYGIIEFPTG